MKTKTMTKNLWDTAKTVLIYSNSIFKKQGNSHINNLILHLKQLEKEQRKPKVSKKQ